MKKKFDKVCLCGQTNSDVKVLLYATDWDMVYDLLCVKKF